MLALGLVAVPLPAAAVDALLLAGLAAVVAVLARAISAGTLRRIPRLPALLLWVVLLRFALCLTAVRVILAHGRGTALIEALGGVLLPGGDLLLGAALLAALLGGQHLLLTRGGERLAEVAARFTLDALPGQQAAIEADLRSGALQPQQAQGRRRELLHQAQLAGALDGALRLLRGDWTALLLLLGVGLIAGIATAVRAGSGALDAAQQLAPALLKLGLVTQVPVLCTAAAAVLLLADGQTASPDSFSASAGPAAGPDAAAADPLHILAPADLAQQLDPTALAPRLLALSAALGDPIPLPLPSPVLSLLPDGAPRTLQASARGMLVLRCALPPPGADSAATAGGSRPAELVLQAVRRHAPALLRIEDVGRMLTALSETQPALLRETMTRRVELPVLTEVMRHLLTEGVVPLPLPAVLEAIALIARPAEDAAGLTEQVRLGLGLRLVQPFLTQPGDLSLQAYRLDQEMEELLRDAAHGTSPAVELDILSELSDHLAQAQARAPAAVLLCPREVRRRVQRLLAEQQAPMPVLSLAELPAQISVSILGYIGPNGLRAA